MTGPTPPRFSSVLVANRGEIVVRVCRTLASRALHSIAIYTDEDEGALHVRRADVAVRVPSYLDAKAIVEAAARTGASAVHPGYGFLSEDATFARTVTGAGLVWIGPPPDAIETMGDKIRAKATVEAAGVPVVPGAGGRGLSDQELAAAALEVGLPVLFKPAAGGGGKGMRRCSTAADLVPAIVASRREAKSAFGDDTLLVERWISRPRHVEVQVFADARGAVVHLGERECSLQRRHQKIVEESPSPLLDDSTRDAMARSAVETARACAYVGAGTVEFIVSGDRPDRYYFMEMNTRLQVEHPVTEAVTGIDLVDWQLRVAAGEPLPLAQHEIFTRGHAVEARVYAEDPSRGFLPATGTVALLREPVGRPHVRVDSALASGLDVGTGYDPMLAKVIAWDETREGAIGSLRAAMTETAVLGVTTNVGYLSRLLDHPDVVAGRLDTELVDRTLTELRAPEAGTEILAAVAAVCAIGAALEPAGPVVEPWGVPDGWSLGGPRPWTVSLRLDAEPVSVRVQGHIATGARLLVGSTEMAVTARTIDDETLLVTVDGETAEWHHAETGGDVWVGRAGCAWRFSPDPVARGEAGDRHAGPRGPVTSPMPGVVVAVHVAVGDRVRAGQALLAVEAMKMEHSVVAPADGVIAALRVRKGDAVGIDEALVEIDEALVEIDAGQGDEP